MFGVCESTAVRYADAARQLLPTDLEAADVEAAAEAGTAGPGTIPPTS